MPNEEVHTSIKTGRITVPVAISLYSAGLILIHIFAAWSPETRTWGFHQLYFFSTWTSLGLVIVASIFLVPRINTLALECLTLWFSRKYFIKASLWLLPAGFVALGWLLRQKTYFLGDGCLMIRHISEYSDSLTSLLTNKHFIGLIYSEPLEIVIHILAYKALNTLDIFRAVFHSADIKSNVAIAYSLVSILAGSAYLYLAVLVSRVMGENRMEKALYLGMLATLGIVQLFCGYVEHYSIFTVVVLAYLFVALRYLQGRQGLLWPTLLLVTAVGLHNVAIIFTPSLLYLCAIDNRRGKLSWVSRNWLTFFSVLTAVAVLLYMFFPNFIKNLLPVAGSPSRHLLPWFGSTSQPYALFTTGHLLDMVNETVLTAPYGMALVVLVYAFGKNRPAVTPRLVFLALAAGLSFLFSLVINPELGSRDWDLLSFPAVPAALWGVSAFLATISDGAAIKRTGLVMLAISFVSVCSWVGVNASEEKSVARYELLLKTDTVPLKYYAHEDLAKYYWDKGSLEKAAQEYLAAIGGSPNNGRLYANLGLLYVQYGQTDKAVEVFYKGLAVDPNDDELESCLLKVYFERKMYDYVVSESVRFLSRNLRSWKVAYLLGAALAKKGDYHKAVMVFNDIIKMKPNFLPALEVLAQIYERQQDSENAVKTWKKMIGLEPGRTDIQAKLNAAFKEVPQ